MKYDLKKIFLKKELKKFFEEIYKNYNESISIVNFSEEIVFGKYPILFPENKHPIIINNDEKIGYIYGPTSVNKIISIICYIIKNEYEKKELALDAIERYREINLFYNISERFTAISDLKDLTAMLLEEASKIIHNTGSAIVLQDNDTSAFNLAAISGAEKSFLFISELMDCFKNEIFNEGHPFIINNISEFQAASKALQERIHSLLTIPIKQKSKITGIFFMWNNVNFEYTSTDLKNGVAIAAQAAFAIENTKLYDELRETFSETIKTLITTIENTESGKTGHSERVSQLCLMIAEEMGLPKKDILLLKFAALLHDIGKIGKLSQMYIHPDVGANIIKNIKKFKDIVPVIRHHHENYDGTGYPDKLKDDQIPLFSRIIAVANFFDNSMELKKNVNFTLKEIQKMANTYFDPAVVKAFLISYEKLAGKKLQ